MDILSRAISHARVTARYYLISPAIWSRISAGYGNIRSARRVELALEMPEKTRRAMLFCTSPDVEAAAATG